MTFLAQLVSSCRMALTSSHRQETLKLGSWTLWETTFFFPLAINFHQKKCDPELEEGDRKVVFFLYFSLQNGWKISISTPSSSIRSVWRHFQRPTFNRQAFRSFVFVMEIRIAYRDGLIGWISVSAGKCSTARKTIHDICIRSLTNKIEKYDKQVQIQVLGTNLRLNMASCKQHYEATF